MKTTLYRLFGVRKANVVRLDVAARFVEVFYELLICGVGWFERMDLG